MSFFASLAAAQQVVFTPATLNFGSISLGGSGSQTVQVTNTSGSKISVTQATISGTGYAISGITCPFSIPQGQSVSFNVIFTPPAAGTDSGQIAIASELWNSNGNHRIRASSTTTSVLPLSGAGAVTAGQLSLSPATNDFGSVNMGSSAVMSGTLSASGSSVTITSSASNNSAFALSGLSYPITLAAGQTVSFSATFTPQSAGSASGAISFASNAANPSITMAVAGTGVAQGQLASNPTAFSFGSVQTGASKTMSGTLTNSGGASVTVSSAGTSSGFILGGLTLPLTLSGGQSVSFTMSYSPTTAGTSSGSLSLASNATNANLSIPLSGTGVVPGTLGSNPASLSFGSVQVGSNNSLYETVTNTGASSVSISQAGVTGAGWSVSGLTLPMTLAGGQSATFSVIYASTSAGSVTGNLAITSDASNATLNIPLSGTGGASGQLAISPSSLSFGTVVVGSSSTLSGNLTATGASVTVSSANSSSNEFVISGLTLPATIAAGQSAPFSVNFAPNATGTATGSLMFASNASNASAALAVSGTGGAATQHSVHLSWTASTNVAGYNVYRGSTSGGPYSIINSSLDATTAYIDSTVAAGQTYYYVVTAVDSSSKESGYSNQTTVVVPTP